MKKKEQFNLALWDRLKKDNIPHDFETRNGKEVTQVTKLESDGHNIVGVKGNEITTWSSDGRYFILPNPESNTDLFIVWEEEQLMLEGWLNIYDAGLPLGYAYKDKISADELAGPTRLACVKFSIPYTKGEGLNNG